MRSPRPARDPQRGNSLLLALIVMSALATLGSLTVVSMQSSIQMSTNERAEAIALYAAESGAAVAMDALRKNFDVDPAGKTTWSRYVVSRNEAPFANLSTLIPSSGARPGDPNHLLGPDQNAWYEIVLLNNRDDDAFGTGTGANETDGKIIIRSTGHGPQGSLAIIECEIQRMGYWGSMFPFPPPQAPAFALPARNPPSFPWDTWTPPPPTHTSTTGMVLLGWHIVSL
jgi:Tfp pilus assembly protein PilX